MSVVLGHMGANLYFLLHCLGHLPELALRDAGLDRIAGLLPGPSHPQPGNRE